MSLETVNTLEEMSGDIQTKYLIFRLIAKKPKTDVYTVLTRLKYPVDSSLHEHHQILGKIYFYAHWRQYLFEAVEEPKLANSCLIDIYNFVEKLNKELRQKNKRGS